jgi:peptidoglycan/xylan/chitin deacetylase (PgdA/CDA1 family)
LAQAGHEIASHGLRHELVYKLPFDVWKEETHTSKKILEDTIGQEVKGYRSPSWTLPFEKRYYEALVELGFAYSSSYFPIKTYLYGNEIDKKHPFSIYTESGTITEIPIPKNIVPFSGGFYLRMLPAPVAALLMKNLMKKNIKPIIYTHPYELQEGLFLSFFNDVVFDKSYILTFANTGNTKKRIEYLLKSVKDDNA